MLHTVDLGLECVSLEVVASIFSVKQCKKTELLDPAMKTLGYYETSVTIYQSWRNIHTEDHYCDSLKSRSPGIFVLGSTALEGLGLLIGNVSGSHSDTPHLVGLLWRSEWPFAETPTRQHIDMHAPGDIRTRNPSKRASAILDRAVTGIGSAGILAYLIPIVENRYTYFPYV
jgi:hypothetical protein